ncbi:UDP-N-acetylmuramoyl-tripeptide--D-alanyl-D-alanine ligase [Alkaliphilus peptidifermentans]|uniref:UDP-N-acetylmuramoyl-tripeptide--D-alanyl-D-alanine ligase n=1 Tax=Alkaliphilus peptidifermentans DSM 18978 TaxID=1120976 RepID=A0A1G5BFB6_9FIRM|nr:UDP-N-acetylmuramoyl-tripeptide--D-alanyl-D-alanine ligase [Alkaliphilus peptidifermentans]SCX88827.1 UDP-N-acetylmuramoyl-tripeptide--D-alanyl-D-alanine ligase [Alkaliphilus peptidifermentans DSM 18978]
MISLTYEEICRGCNGHIISKGASTSAYGVSTDTRTIQKGMLFVPLMGENFDGHTFIEEAKIKGATGAIIEKNRSLNLSVLDSMYLIEVEDTLEALSRLSKFYRNMFNIPFVGVTGSTGKTSTKDMISAVLSSHFSVLKNIGNFNNHIGLPLTLFNLEKHNQVAVLEMGMSAFGEISMLAEIVRPKIGVITNIGMSHIEHLGSKENIMKAKMEIAEHMTEDNYLIINGDDEYLKKLKGQKTPYTKIFYGIGQDNDLYPSSISENEDGGYSISITINDREATFNIKQYGLHNVYNGLVAIWIGNYFGLSPDKIQQAFDFYSPSKMRMEILELHNFKVINDTYNASPDSMKAAIDVLKHIKGKRKIAVLGNMLEMGAFSEEGHRLVGSYLVKAGVDGLIAVGDEARWIAMEVNYINSSINTIIVDDNKQACIKLNEMLENDDVILIKGSRGMQMEEIVNFLQERS